MSGRRTSPPGRHASRPAAAHPGVPGLPVAGLSVTRASVTGAAPANPAAAKPNRDNPAPVKPTPANPAPANPPSTHPTATPPDHAGARPARARAGRAAARPSRPDPESAPGPAPRADAARWRGPGGITLAATPIGAARDITLRTLDLMRDSDVIAAEDTRSARRLMDIHGIPLDGRRLVACHDHSGPAVESRLVSLAADGAAVLYLAEAGTPAISDPGFTLVRASHAAGVPVTAAPGASALLAALAVAGLPTDRFLFAGFLPPAREARRAAIAELGAVPATLVLYESPARVAATLADLAALLGPRPAAVCRELTKRFEEVRRGSLADLAATIGEPRGEYVLVIGRGEARPPGEAEIDAALRDALATMRVRDAAQAVAGALGLPRAEVYRRALALQAPR